MGAKKWTVPFWKCGGSVGDSIPALLDALRGIREVDVLYPAREADGEAELRTTLSRMTDEQRAMFDILGLENLAI